MRKLKADASFKLKREDEHPLRRGQEFETDDENAADLVSMGMATDLGEAISKAADSTLHIPRRRNTYNRRDMVAAADGKEEE